MMFIQVLASLALATCAFASPAPGMHTGRDAPPELKGKRSMELRDGVEHTIFEHEPSGAKIDFVTNSGVCETTPGVNQYSGYVEVGSESIFSCRGPKIAAYSDFR